MSDPAARGDDLLALIDRRLAMMVALLEKATQGAAIAEATSAILGRIDRLEAKLAAGTEAEAGKQATNAADLRAEMARVMLHLKDQDKAIDKRLEMMVAVARDLKAPAGKAPAAAPAGGPKAVDLAALLRDEAKQRAADTAALKSLIAELAMGTTRPGVTAPADARAATRAMSEKAMSEIGKVSDQAQRAVYQTAIATGKVQRAKQVAALVREVVVSVSAGLFATAGILYFTGALPALARLLVHR